MTETVSGDRARALTFCIEGGRGTAHTRTHTYTKNCYLHSIFLSFSVCYEETNASWVCKIYSDICVLIRLLEVSRKPRYFFVSAG